MYLIDAYNLQHRHTNGKFSYYRGTVQQSVYCTAARTQFWYRAMTKREFEHLSRNNRFHSFSYGGIAPNHEYATHYLNNGSEATHIVEFRTPYQGFLYTDFSRLGFQPKVEGGGTYGLGMTGTRGGLAGREFNRLLATRRITWELVDLRLPAA